MAHIDYPHFPGSLYGCAECMDNCYCDDSLKLPAGETVPCLHCELEEERARVEMHYVDSDPGPWS